MAPDVIAFRLRPPLRSQATASAENGVDEEAIHAAYLKLTAT
jgi:hypothetical protein